MATVEEYLNGLSEPRRSEVAALHAFISKTFPHLKPSMQSGMIGYGTYHYKYESGREGDAPVIGLSSRAQYISIYACEASSHKAALPKANIGNSCIRIKRLSDIDLKALGKVLSEAAKRTAKKHKIL